MKSSLLNYTTLGDPFEFKGSTWAEVIVGHGRERQGAAAAVGEE